ncbi:MAG: hypothetical protein D6801_07885 [Alphaproteobacteria bacterium]|nr:MAG: hypothetical protein D6801_07885 [Alphaproteobacteria bacterium]
MLRNTHPAEELHEIRSEIRALKAREAELCAWFLSGAPPTHLRGPAHEVRIGWNRHRVFQVELLPDAILEDPTMWELRASPVIELVPAPPMRDCAPQGFMALPPAPAAAGAMGLAAPG